MTSLSKEIEKKKEARPGPQPMRNRSVLLEYLRYPEFKRLFTQLQSILDADGLKTVAVVSAHPQEGKSFVCASLALAFARLMHRRVVILDTVNQTKSRSLYHQAVYGVTESGEVSPQVPGRIELLTTRNDAGVMSDIADFEMAKYIQTLRKEHDLILIDTCALDSVSRDHIDPAVLSRSVDGVILVTSPTSIDRETIAQLTRDFKRWDVRVIGAIFNRGAVE